MDQPVIQGRHIQDHDAATSEIPHWGYSSRVWPCKNDPGSCAYLDAVYWMHDVSMLYTFIMWAVIGGLLAIVLVFRIAKPRPRAVVQKPEEHEPEGQAKGTAKGSYARAWGAVSAACRRRLLPEIFHSLFGHVSRLQVLILACICVYLTIFSFVGMVYKTWTTPVKDTNLFNTRSTSGGFSDRIGALAYALTPLTVGLSTRESILSLLTGIPYQHFNFLHRWTGRIIFLQSLVHTIIWTVIEGRLYQPQPEVWVTWIRKLYMVFGIIAQILITFLYLFSIKAVVRWTGHEFFRKSHYIAGVLYLGACWGHWPGLACWMIASIGIVFLDRGLRLLRTALIHFHLKDEKSGIGFKSAQTHVLSFDDGDGGTVVRLDFVHKHAAWDIGQHFFLCFPELTVWQSHPFTPISSPTPGYSEQHHVYIMRCLRGETARLATLAAKDTPVILTGPFGGSSLDKSARNVLTVAGGTGISFTLPIAMEAVRTAREPTRVELVWIIRHAQNTAWIQDELDTLLVAADHVSESAAKLNVRVFVTREGTGTSVATSKEVDASLPPSPDEKTPTTTTAVRAATEMSDVFADRANVHIEWLKDHHPDMESVVSQFMQSSPEAEGKTQVLASGPAGLGRDLRAAVASANDGSKVWSGKDGYDVGLYWDNRFFH